MQMSGPNCGRLTEPLEKPQSESSGALSFLDTPSGGSLSRQTFAKPPIGTNAEGAARYLGISLNRFYELTSSGLIQRLGKDWFSYDDLNAGMELIRQRRDNGLYGGKGAQIQTESNEKRNQSKSKARRKMGGEGQGPYDGQAKSFYGPTKAEAERKASESIKLSNYETLAGYFYSVYLPKVANKSEGWQDQIIYAMEKLVLPRFGHMELVTLSRPMLQAAFTDWAKERKPNGELRFKRVSLQKVKIVFSGILSLAEDDDLIVKTL